MTTLFRPELQNKVEELQSALKQKNIIAEYDEKSFRDYCVILQIQNSKEKISIYYKPSTNTFSLKKKIENSETDKTIDNIWDALNGAQVYSAESGIYEAFVDGSYINDITGYGAVIYLGDEVKAELSGTIDAPEYRQFGGELKSVVETIKWCKENNVSKIRINYDYEGIEKFVLGVWKPKNELSQEYVKIVKNSGLQFEWRHIKSHTGNSKNDLADKLAKSAAESAIKQNLF